LPSSSRQKSKAKPAPKKAVAARRPPPRRASPPPKKSPPAKPASKPAPKSASAASAAAKALPVELEVPLPDGRKHLLSLAFVRDGDEFMARLETDSGHIMELKNRSLDQLLTLVASELEDLIE
jgi:hypothetical protein